MEWHGLDIVAACQNNLIQTEFDMCSIYLQFIWVFLTVGDRLNISNPDIHAGNLWVKSAPRGGHFLMTFQLRHGETLHQVSLRTRLMLTVGDWGIYQQSSYSAPAHSELQDFFRKERTIRSISRTNSKGSSLSSSSPSLSRHKRSSEPWHPLISARNTFCNPVELYSAWSQIAQQIYGFAPPFRREFSSIFTRTAPAVLQFVLTSKSFAQAHNSEYMHLDFEFDEATSEVIESHPIGFNSFEQREYVEWVSNEKLRPQQMESMATVPTLVESPQPLPLSPRIQPKRSAKDKMIPQPIQSLPVAGRRGRGRPPKNGIAPMSRKERNAMRSQKRAAENLEMMQRIAAQREKHMLKNRREAHGGDLEPIGIPLDTTLVVVKPSFLSIEGQMTNVGLGVFATQKIPAGTAVTSYCGTWRLEDYPTTLSKKHTHLLSLGASRNPSDVLDGLRYPRAGCGVASLINSCKGTTSTANVKFQKQNEVNRKSAVAISLRDIEAGEELLDDYEPVLLN